MMNPYEKSSVKKTSGLSSSQDEMKHESFNTFFNMETELIPRSLKTEAEDSSKRHHTKLYSQGDFIHDLYQVEGLLGEGGMGRVYLCRNLKLGNLWAVKHIDFAKVKDSRFIAEENILKKLNHIYIPQIIDRFEDDTGVYIVETYIEGLPLHKKMVLEGPFSENQVVEWGIQLTDVLQYLHSLKPNPIIYRDMKPSNVMITPDNKAIVIDFGISTELTPSSPGAYPPSLIAITTGFAAPEQYYSYGDQRSDIYSLGIMLYYLLTKALPGQETVNGNISKKMLEIIEKCIKAEVIERYQRVDALRQDLIRHREAMERAHLQEKSREGPLFGIPRDYRKLILCISPEATGKTTLAVNLAQLLSKKGIKTILIDGDWVKKDIYYHFNKDYFDCMASINEKTFLKAGNRINGNLTVYSEHRDREVEIDVHRLPILLTIAKNNAQVTIVDVGRNFVIEELNSLLSYADQIYLVVDQRINSLNRLVPYLTQLSIQNLKMDVVVNRYIEGATLGEKQIRDFFKRIETEEDFINIPVERIFTLSEDYGAIITGLSERKPAIEVEENKLLRDLEKIAQHCFPLIKEEEKTFLKGIGKLFKF